MPVTVSYPGVYIEEIPTAPRSISGVETSITAFIGRALRGPTDKDDLGNSGDAYINSWGDYERTFGGLWTESALSYAVRDFFNNGGSRAVIIRVFHADGPSQALIQAGSVNLVAASPGAWGNHLTVEIDHATRPADPQTDGTLFNLTVTDTGTGNSERYINVTLVEHLPNSLDLVLKAQSELLRVQPGSMGGARPDATSAPLVVKGPAGDGASLDEADLLGQADAKTGLYALNKVDLVNIVCVPPYQPSREVDLSVLTTAAQICIDRRAFLIIDAPVSWTTSDAATRGVGTIAQALGANGRNAALFFPWLCPSQPPQDGPLDAFPPCGAVAGVFARTDANRGVWKAPAGVDATLSGVDSFSVKINDQDNEVLNVLGVNCLRSRPPVGPVVWGARTLLAKDAMGTPEWKYIPVRRLGLYLEESVLRGTQWTVFEPNDERLWAQLRLSINAFLQGLYQQGAFAGATASQAYFVICDSSTTTAHDLAMGVVNIQVGYAPIYPAEFVILNFALQASQQA